MIEITCLRCHKKFLSKLIKNKRTGKKEFRAVFCGKCTREMNRTKGMEQKQKMHHIKLISEKINLANEVEALRRMELINPRLIERLRRESAEKAKKGAQVEAGN